MAFITKPRATVAVILSSIFLTLTLSACQATPIAQADDKPATMSTTIINQANKSTMKQAPWSKVPISDSEIDTVYRQEWLKSESRGTCPILALPKQSSAHLQGFSARRANFAGGWGVAYDLPTLRSAYGVANTGTLDPNESYNNWPFNVVYRDGSMASYGHEGGNPEANWLAYIIITQNNCFYNVWSAQSKAHLEQMIADLRLVRAR